MSVVLSEEQGEVFQNIMLWLDQELGSQYKVLGGLAGTGKTHLISYLYEKACREGYSVAIAAYTGKAVSVLKEKLPEIGEDISTIHHLIYDSYYEGGVWFNERKTSIPFDFVIIDEASMVSEWIHKDLLLVCKRILYVGDHGPLPPVEGRFNVMQRPDFKLEKIHRQALDSPIIRLSMMAREGKMIPFSDFGIS